MSSRRTLLKGAAGLWSAALTGVVLEQKTEAARRGYGGPTLPSGSGGLRYEIFSNANGILYVVPLSGLGPTEYSVTINNRTRFDFKVDISHLDHVLDSYWLIARDTLYVELGGEGVFQFTVSRGDGPVLLKWEARI